MFSSCFPLFNSFDAFRADSKFSITDSNIPSLSINNCFSRCSSFNKFLSDSTLR
ncbi:unnamed protein product [Meloidogyne enterolobii]|uniref:Uncharacterized protein n=1 Tax=Meloidogyne enterolobii TaxID=390850 RepID=A0ACB0ZSW8_MELEN